MEAKYQKNIKNNDGIYMYANTGKGSNYFERLYDWIDISQIRQEPSTKEDFLEDGLSEKDFADYIDFVKRLYGVYFISNNLLAIKYEKNPAEMDVVCEEFKLIYVA